MFVALGLRVHRLSLLSLSSIGGKCIFKGLGGAMAKQMDRGSEGNRTIREVVDSKRMLHI